MLPSPPAAAAEVGRGSKSGNATKEKVESRGSTDEAVEAPTRTVVARPRLPAAVAAAPKPPKVVPPRRDATGVASGAVGRLTTRRRDAADAKDRSTLPMSASVRGAAMKPLQQTGSRR